MSPMPRSTTLRGRISESSRAGRGVAAGGTVQGRADREGRRRPAPHPEIGRGAVESKRPTRVDLLHNLNEIGRQLRDREADGSQYGAAVIGGDRIAQTASNAFEAETAEEANAGVRNIATTLAEEVEGVSKDVACEVVPAASRAIVIVTGAVLVRRPRTILQPLVSAIGFPPGQPARSPGRPSSLRRPSRACARGHVGGQPRRDESTRARAHRSRRGRDRRRSRQWGKC
jgi:hypothetical protein